MTLYLTYLLNMTWFFYPHPSSIAFVDIKVFILIAPAFSESSMAKEYFWRNLNIGGFVLILEQKWAEKC